MTSSNRGPGATSDHPRPDDEISTSSHTSADAHAEPVVPTVAEIAAMNDEEAMIAGAAVDGVYIEHRRQRFPVPGTNAAGDDPTGNRAGVT